MGCLECSNSFPFVPCSGSACKYGNLFFALKRKKQKVLDRAQNGFKCEDNNNNFKEQQQQVFAKGVFASLARGLLNWQTPDGHILNGRTGKRTINKWGGRESQFT